MDRLEVEVALGHQCRDRVGARGTNSAREILQGHRLEARLAGIVRHQFGAIPRDGRLALPNCAGSLHCVLEPGALVQKPIQAATASVAPPFSTR